MLADYGLSETELLQNLSLYNPVDNLHGLAQYRVPMFVVHGDEDKLVPYEENSGLLMKNYTELSGQIVVELIPGEGHKVTPSFFESRALLRFVIKQSRSI